MLTATTPHSLITLRAYCDEDWPAVCAIHDQARPHELEGSCDRRAFIPLANDQEGLDDFHRSEKFVACIGDTVVGFIGIDETLISWLYVAPDYFGHGIGRELLQLGLEIAGPQAWTIVLAQNSRARTLYESEGFQVVNIFESTNAGYPCVCMELSLQPAAIEKNQYHAA